MSIKNRKYLKKRTKMCLLNTVYVRVQTKGKLKPNYKINR